MPRRACSLPRHVRRPRCCGRRRLSCCRRLGLSCYGCGLSRDRRGRSCRRRRRSRCRSRLKCRCIDSGKPKRAATFPVEARNPDKPGTTDDAIYRQSLLRGACEISEEVDQETLFRTLSFRHHFYAVVVQRLQFGAAPCSQDGIEGSGAKRHFCYSRRLADLAGVILDVAVCFTPTEKCRLLSPIRISNGPVLRVKDRI